MEENIFYDNINDENNNNENNNTDIKTIMKNDNENNNKDEFANYLPSWDLEPPYEEIRRN